MRVYFFTDQKIRTAVSAISILCMIWAISAGPAYASEKSQIHTAPTTHNGKKWRIGYIEGGPYQDYQSILKALLSSLTEMGWIEPKPFPVCENEKETRTIWQWLGTDVKSHYLEFVEDAYWSAGWDKKVREKNRDTIIRRLNTGKDIDLMLAFGTRAGQDMANNRHHIPVMVLSASDPVRAGIIRSAEDSGYDHVHARVDPKRYERQVRLFHDIVGFKRLGIAYRNDSPGRSYAAIEDVRRVAAETGFELAECPEVAETPDIDKVAESLVRCHEKLAPQVDAFYITVNSGVTKESLPQLLAPFFKHKIPTFAQGRTGEVRHGVLMSMAQESFLGSGRFHAEIFARILNGAKPRDLPMRYESPPEIAVNLETASRIGFHFPLEVLGGAQQIYESIETVSSD